MIFILDKQEKVVGVLQNGSGTTAPTFFDDKLTEDLATGAETFQFSSVATGNLATELVIGNYVAFKKGKSYKLFQIMQTEEVHDDIMYVTVYAESAGLELINKVFRARKMVSYSLRRFLETVLDETGWSVGGVSAHSMNSFDFDLQDASVYSIIQNNIGKYEVELEFRVEIEQGKISKKYVDTYTNRGRVTGKRFAYGRDIEKVTRKVDSTELYTALIGKGTNDIHFKDITMDGIDKPLGQDFVADQNAFEAYNHNGYHLMGVFKYDTTDQYELLRETYKQLQKCKVPKIEYTLSVALLGELLGEDWNKIEIGDTVAVVDNAFNPPIHLMARVSKLESSLTDNTDSVCTLSNFVEVRSNITDEMRQLASELEGYVNGAIDGKFPIGGEDIEQGAIQGGHIYENSITTDHLIADCVTAEKIKADSIEAEHISADAITVDHLTASVIEAINASIGEATIDSAKINSAQIADLVVKDLKVGNAQITDLDAGKINAGQINTNVLTANIIKAINLSVENATIDSAKIGELSADKISANIIEAINMNVSGKIKAELIDVGNLTVDNVDAGKIVTGTLDADRIGANTITGEKIVANTITTDHLQANSITADKIDSEAINTDLLKASVIEAINISTSEAKIDSAKIGQLSAENINAIEIGADQIQANVISAINSYTGTAKIKQAQMEELKVGSANIIDLDVSKLTGDKISADLIDVKNITVTGANIDELNANKIKGGKLDLNQLEIGSTSGNLTIQENTLQIKDNQATPVTRVQLGKDSTGNYGLVVVNDKGKAIFDSTKGVLSADGLADGVVSEDKIVDNAIGSSKLNIEELFVSDGAFINKLTAVEIDANQITTGKISSERIDITGLVSFESFSDQFKDSIFDVQGDKTYINGGMIATNSIKADKIDLLSGLNVRGEDNTTTFSIASNGTVEVNGLLKSGNFDEDRQTGYKISPDGTAILNQATVRGTVQLPNAGITDYGSNNEGFNHVRFWAGTSYDNRDNAPFRVMQNGDLVANRGTFGGTVVSDEVNIGNVHLHEDSIVLNSTLKAMTYDGDVFAVNPHHAGESPFVNINKDYGLFDTNFILGSIEDKKIEFLNGDKVLNLNNVSFNAIGAQTDLSFIPNSKENGGLSLSGKTGGQQIIRHSESEAGTLIFDSKGSQGNRGDFSFTRKNYSETENVKVDVDGEVQIKTKLSGKSNNMEMRVTETGFAFYSV